MVVYFEHRFNVSLKSYQMEKKKHTHTHTFNNNTHMHMLL